MTPTAAGDVPVRRAGAAGAPTSSDSERAPAMSVAGRRHTTRWVAGGVLGIGAVLVAVLATRPPATADEVSTPIVGQHAPQIVAHTVDGSAFDLAALRGRWVVVNFFASWCPPCQQEQPDLVTFAYHHRGPADPALVGVVFNDNAANARAFLRGSGATWPAVVDPGGQIALDYGVRGPPETFFVSPDGIVVAHFDGPMTDSALDYWLGKAEQGAP